MSNDSHLRLPLLALCLTAFLGATNVAQQAETVQEAPNKSSESATAETSTNEKPATDARAVPVTLEKVGQFIGKKVVIEYTVHSSTLIDEKKICFLNSLKNYRDDKNFTVIIKSDSLEEFAKSEIVNPARHYYGKKIRVTGVIAEHRGKPQLQVTKVAQIKILKPTKSDKTDQTIQQAEKPTGAETK